MTENRRQHPRFAFDKPVQYRTNDAVDPMGSLARDISLGGIQMTVNEFMALGTVLELGLTFPNSIAQANVRGKVVWIRENAFSERFDIGLEFIQDEHTAAMMSAILNKSNW